MGDGRCRRTGPSVSPPARCGRDRRKRDAMTGLAASNTVITGAAMGIGRAIAARAARAGARVVLGDVDVDRLEGTARELRDAGAEVAWLRCDVRHTTQLEELVQVCRQHFGEPDVLFANAGI